jgi:site-specific recombinase XerD
MSTFKDYLQFTGKSKSTITHYNSYALDFISFLDRDNTEPENATAKEVLSYLNHLQKKGQENKTRNIRLNVIKQFFNWQIEQGHRTDNPIAHLKIRGSKTQKLYPVLSRQELDEIFNKYQIPTEEHKKANCNWFTAYRLSKQRNKAILSLMVNQGLTTPEIERMELTDLKLKEGEIFIRGSRRSNERTLELKSNQIMELMEYQYTTRNELLKYQQSKTNRLFLPVPTAGQQQANDTLQIWKGLTKEIKAQNGKFINFKQVRTSIITHWLKTYNLRQVQYMAGHRYISSTESYLVNQTEDLQADIDNYHPF